MQLEVAVRSCDVNGIEEVLCKKGPGELTANSKQGWQVALASYRWGTARTSGNSHAPERRALASARDLLGPQPNSELSPHRETPRIRVSGDGYRYLPP